ncbi:uncharacterized protein [Neodiprion pinetum]|uniref:Uncharacterized protein LOC107216490 n=1 Tax=Neodiprion lecontei TaxID=441921 RepID=A0A6J0B4U1_NEOLC|nr:uncharacterized protein LOC107216490 [Neodiprion lecontei]XP_046413399.1 uncharacterized protein LOC124176318 [Neodiprion fabricii]XP_046469012.1 uncharacterized protein LOC124212703 [Neodiprion pinetum]XP_046606757.1 uncharacterized protein LOC124298602 [Neodiprion virginianus]
MFVANYFFAISGLLGVVCIAGIAESVTSKCSGRPHYNVSLTAYYPDFNSGFESDYLDARGKKLRPLQNFLDGRCDYVTVGMDEDLNLAYGSSICVPEMNEHFGINIPFQVRDYGANLKGTGFSRMDICVRSEEDSYDKTVNGIVTIYV